MILDWKRTISIKFDNAFRSLQEPLQHLPDSNGWLYSLQLNVYKCPAAAVSFGCVAVWAAYAGVRQMCTERILTALYMLETEYGMRVSKMYLGQVHPCLPRARLIEVPCMRQKEMELIVEDQKDRRTSKFSVSLGIVPHFDARNHRKT